MIRGFPRQGSPARKFCFVLSKKLIAFGSQYFPSLLKRR